MAASPPHDPATVPVVMRQALAEALDALDHMSDDELMRRIAEHAQQAAWPAGEDEL